MPSKYKTWLVGALLAAGCTAAVNSHAMAPIGLIHGDQIKLWGSDVSVATDALEVRAQADRKPLPKGPLVEHVHAEALDQSGQVKAVHDATIYPVTTLRGRGGTANVRVRLPAAVLEGGGSIQLRVVDGPQHG